MSQVLVTGATGFIGSAVTHALVAGGYDVVAPCRDVDRARRLFPTNRVRVCRVDQGGFLPAGLDQIGAVAAVMHFAVDYGRDNAPASRVAEINVCGSLRLLEWSAHSGVKLFVNADTCFPVDYPYMRSYTLSKKQFVTWGEGVSADADLRFVNMVLQHPFGPGDRPGKFVPWLIHRCLTESESIDLTAGNQRKDFVFVGDVADACLCVLQSASRLESGATHYDVGRGEPVSVRQFVELVHSSCGSSATLNFGALPNRDGEPFISVARIAPLAELGWVPKVTLEEGVAKTVATEQRSIARRQVL